ncbi:hypothetical protein K474DRAFT_1668489, partial [Panus rudis PR-1116 ss-1]
MPAKPTKPTSKPANGNKTNNHADYQDPKSDSSTRGRRGRGSRERSPTRTPSRSRSPPRKGKSPVPHRSRTPPRTSPRLKKTPPPASDDTAEHNISRKGRIDGGNKTANSPKSKEGTSRAKDRESEGKDNVEDPENKYDDDDLEHMDPQEVPKIEGGKKEEEDEYDEEEEVQEYHSDDERRAKKYQKLEKLSVALAAYNARRASAAHLKVLLPFKRLSRFAPRNIGPFTSVSIAFHYSMFSGDDDHASRAQLEDTNLSTRRGVPNPNAVGTTSPLAAYSALNIAWQNSMKIL